MTSLSEKMQALKKAMTPGPWERLPNSTNINCPTAHAGTVASDGWHICLVFADGRVLEKDAEANATVIALAADLPDLVVALEEIAEMYRSCGERGDVPRPGKVYDKTVALLSSIAARMEE